MVSEHYYASGTQHTDMKLGKKVPIEPPLSSIELQRAAAVQVRAKYEHYEKYLELIPALRARPVPIAIDEWAYFLPGKRESYSTVPGLCLGLPRDVSPLRHLPDGEPHLCYRDF